MEHPFRIGRHYRNRKGEYEVIAIEDSSMVLRYLDGSVLESPVALQARIWEHLQEEDSDESEASFLGYKYTDESRKTEDIRLFVEAVLKTFKQPWPSDITDQACLAIEQMPEWLSHYQELVEDHGKLTVNSFIGYYVRDLTGMENTGRTATSKSQLIKSYSVLVASLK